MFSEKRTLFQWINFFIPYIYAGGIVVIFSWMVIASSIFLIETVQDDPKAIFLHPQTENTEVEIINQQDTWMNVVVKPIVESPLNKIIFRGIFLLIIWMLFFLVIPVAFKRLKRFKFFNLEFEVENIEQAAIHTVEVSGGKAKLMAYLTSEQAAGKTLEFLNDASIDFFEVLQYFLEEIQTGYRNYFEAPFSYAVFSESLPENLIDLMEESKETGEAVIKNKVDNEHLLKKNYLLYYYIHEEKEVFTVLSSYRYQFDIFDKYLIELLHNTINKNIENIEYIVTITSPIDE
ncbi:hypothetical protein H1Z61_05240 [Bacillus aquiflavi]|uniref:Uncharacterized protein n=1 Tax=Bacillus aquiflavi TaxID=2672567 RepID=A0A6B3VZC7_9BACI|nr:hypothetical protein [Bacillus aquiflavi]MBA4536569.1 hypothetical protein [Bacillus aquiflavi]NEY80936.1 hypothetical protein [Bacillus aquiflavi]UAC49652.1 hypothetical protein K6959_07570 [Bacillus aquiflavi]